MYGIQFPRNLTPQFLYLRVYGIELCLVGTSLEVLPHLLSGLIRISASQSLCDWLNLVSKTIPYGLREITVIPNRISGGFEIGCHLSF